MKGSANLFIRACNTNTAFGKSFLGYDCETYFVAKNDDFINFVKELSELNNQNDSNVKQLKETKMKIQKNILQIKIG